MQHRTITTQYLDRFRDVAGTAASCSPSPARSAGFCSPGAWTRAGAPPSSPLLHLPPRLRRPEPPPVRRRVPRRPAPRPAGRPVTVRGVPALRAADAGPRADRVVPRPGESAADALRRTLADWPAEGPPLRLFLAAETAGAEGREILAVAMDHAACDEASLGRVLAGLTDAYRDALGPGTSPRSARPANWTPTARPSTCNSPRRPARRAPAPSPTGPRGPPPSARPPHPARPAPARAPAPPGTGCPSRRTTPGPPPSPSSSTPAPPPRAPSTERTSSRPWATRGAAGPPGRPPPWVASSTPSSTPPPPRGSPSGPPPGGTTSTTRTPPSTRSSTPPARRARPGPGGSTACSPSKTSPTGRRCGSATPPGARRTSTAARSRPRSPCPSPTGPTSSYGWPGTGTASPTTSPSTPSTPCSPPCAPTRRPPYRWADTAFRTTRFPPPPPRDTGPSTTSRKGSTMFPLSSSQEIVWLHEQMLPGSRAYNFTATIDLWGTLDEDALTEGLATALARHPGLRLELVATAEALPGQRVREECAPACGRWTSGASPTPAPPSTGC
ncbi:condensation domain-containing protein [Streptomyces stramineus]